MTEAEFTDALAELLDAASNPSEGLAPEWRDARVCSFREAGLLTSNAGLVVRLADGSEWQLTVVRSRRPS